MTNDSIRQALHAQPFVPFVIHMPDGREFEVRHPEMVLAPPRERTIVVHLGEGRYNFVDLLTISSLGFDKTRRNRSNGRRRAG